MKVVITIIGYDCVGIVAMVTTELAQNNINILDINQSIINGLFNMVLIADMEKSKVSLQEIQESLGAKGAAMGLQIKVQHEDIFNIMHKV